MLDEYKVFAHLSFDVTCSACYAQLPAYLAALVEVTGDCVAPTLPTLASRSNGVARTAYKDFVTYQAIRTSIEALCDAVPCETNPMSTGGFAMVRHSSQQMPVTCGQELISQEELANIMEHQKVYRHFVSV